MVAAGHAVPRWCQPTNRSIADSWQTDRGCVWDRQQFNIISVTMYVQQTFLWLTLSLDWHMRAIYQEPVCSWYRLCVVSQIV